MIQNIETKRIDPLPGISVFIRRSFNGAFVIDEDALRRLSGIVAEVSETCDYIVTLESGVTFKLDTIDAVLNVHNPAENPIRAIEVRTSANQEFGVKVRITSERQWRSGYWHVFSTFGEKDASYLSQRLDDWVAGIQPWYSGIATLNFILTFFGVLFTAFLGLLLIALIPTDPGGPVEEGHRFALSELSQLVGSWIWVTPVILAIPADFIRSRLFPKGTFAIGDGVYRYMRAMAWRNAFMLGVGVLLLASIVMALLLIAPAIF
jgi:hypothetical protein